MPAAMRRTDFRFDLPKELIAQRPTEQRSASRLLALAVDGTHQDLSFRDLPSLLNPGDLLVFNDTRVVPARVHGTKDSGGKIEILLERATKMNLVASDAEVEDKFTESKSPYTEEEFQKKLKETGLTVDDLRSDIRRQLSIQKLLNREVVAKISITDQDIQDFYSKNRAQFNVTEPEYHIAQIVITPHPDATVHNRKNDKATNEAEAGRKAAMLIQKINAGGDFAELAADYSEDSSASTGGDLGFQPESAFDKSDPVLKKAVLSLRPGQTTQPLHDPRGGYIIVKLIAKEAAGERQFSDPQVQQAIRDALRTRKEQLLRSAYLVEARDESHVTNYLAQQILEFAGKLPAKTP